MRKAGGRRHTCGAAKAGISQPSHGLDGRYGTAASMPGTLQHADLQIRIPAHWAGRGALIHESDAPDVSASGAYPWTAKVRELTVTPSQPGI